MFESLSAWLMEEVVVIVAIHCKLKQPGSKQSNWVGSEIEAICS